ncbi:MAG TPA: ATP-binding protein [Solirubrobacteraceae bacterium]|nr:ATP-binding protein [Solirubrobacteraceae bacterium]
MNSSWKHLAVVSVLGVLLAGGVGGLALELVDSQSQTSAQLRRAAEVRASLGAALINSALRFDGSGAGTVSPRRSSAVPPPLTGYLADASQYTVHPLQTQVLLIDAGDRVIAASGRGTSLGPLRDAPLRRALAGGAGAGTFGTSGGRFFAVARLTRAPWRVVYTLPTDALYGSRAGTWSLSFMLLGGFAAVAAVCLILLIRLLGGSDRLARANAALAERNEMIEEATAAKTRFVANMSHELRTPLNAVIGFSELMHTGRTGPLSKRQREFLGIIRASADHLLTLINEVLDLSKIESGHMRLDPEAIDPVVVASECVSSMRWLAADRRIRLQLEAAAVGPLSLDPARLRQVILNYLSNAIKFTAAGGQVTLTVARDGDRLLVAVADSGVGIAPEDQRRVFDEFVQVGSSAHPGSGLGLAVTREIVEAQGGEVSVTSRPGFGSTFYAWLPWVSAATAPLAAAASAGSVEPAGTVEPEQPVDPVGAVAPMPPDRVRRAESARVPV